MNIGTSHSSVFPRELGKKKTIELAYNPVDKSHSDELSLVNLDELPLFKFDVLKKATGNFAEAKKLGKGGFGPVYKVKFSCCFFTLLHL